MQYYWIHQDSGKHDASLFMRDAMLIHNFPYYGSDL